MLHCPLILLCFPFVFISQSFPQSLLQSPKFSPWPLAQGLKQAWIACPCLTRESKQPKAKSPCSPIIKMFHQHTWIQHPPSALSLIRSPRGEADPGEPETSPPYLHPAVCGRMLFSTGWAWLMQDLSCPWAGALIADSPCFYYWEDIFTLWETELNLGRENASPACWWPDFGKPPYSGQPESF